MIRQQRQEIQQRLLLVILGGKIWKRQSENIEDDRKDETWWDGERRSIMWDVLGVSGGKYYKEYQERIGSVLGKKY